MKEEANVKENLLLAVLEACVSREARRVGRQEHINHHHQKQLHVKGTKYSKLF
jgi:hypothetical protein